MGTDRHDVVIEEAERLWRMGGKVGTLPNMEVKRPTLEK